MFEFHILRRLPHFVFQAGDRFFKLFRRVFFERVEIQRNFEVIGFIRGDEGRFDGFDDRRRRDAVFLVIFFLNSSNP